MAGRPGEGSEARGRLEPLEAALACLDALPGAERFAAGRERLAELGARLAEGRFHLAVLGQFKRGKSTLLNALLGAPLLPASVLPLTAIPTFLRHGPPELRVAFADRPAERHGAEDATALRALLERFASETGNPGNRLGVTRVEASYPSAALQGGAVLIDTPGIGSGLRHNTDTTLAFLPQCDAALFVLSADPPPTEAELAFLARVRAQVPRLFFVLNKIDYLGPEEREAAEAFLRRTLAEQAGVAEPVIFPVSAARGLAARERGDEARWRESGMAALERALQAFLSRDKDAALQEAVRRKAALELAELGLQLGLEERSLTLPLTELKERQAALRGTAQEAERARAAELFELPAAPAAEAEAPPLLPRLHWVTEAWPSDFSSLSLSALERLLPPRQRQRRLEAQLRERLEGLVRLNVEKVRWTLLQTSDAALARAGAALAERLDATVAATYGAIAGAAARRERGEAEAQGELAALRAARAELGRLAAALGA